MAMRIELAKYPKRSDIRSSLTVIVHLALVVSPLVVAARMGPSWWWILLWMSFGFLMNGLLNLMHECAHYHVFVGRQGSDLLGRWILGPLAIADFDGYRWRHWKHHTNFGIDGDPKDTYLVDIRGSKLITFFLRCLTLSEALRKLRHASTQGEGQEKTTLNPMLWLARTAVFQALLFGLLLVVAGPAAGRAWTQAFLVAVMVYSVIYVYGLGSLTVFAATLRAVAEHQLEAGQIPSPRRGALRNFKCGPISRLIFGAYGFAEHGTHHVEPSLPYYHLTAATNELAKDDPELAPDHQYIKELAELCRTYPLQPSAGESR
jgi:fatty acid desaturase